MKFLASINRNSLGFQAAAQVSLQLIVFFVVPLLILNNGLEVEYNRIAQQAIQNDAEVIFQRFQQFREESLHETRFLTNNPQLIDAVARNDAETVISIVEGYIIEFQVADIDVVNAQGSVISTTISSNDESEVELINQILQSSEPIVGIINDDDELRLGIGMTFLDESGVVTGAILISNNIDENFLSELNLEREAFDLGLIYQNELIAINLGEDADHHDDEVTSVTGEDDDHPEEEFEEYGVAMRNIPLIQQAINSESITIDNQFIEIDDHLHKSVFIPLVLNDNQQLVVSLLNRQDDIIAARQNLLTQMTFAFAIIMGITAISAFFGVRAGLVRPLTQLNNLARQIANGDYNQRIPVKTQNEIGQLAQSFNTMAGAIYYRDNEQIKMLEERIIEVQKARELAEQADEAKSAFLASMSHELRTPLNAIINFTRFVADGDVGTVNDQQKELLGSVANSGKYLLGLINDVLDMSKIESGSLNLFVEDNIDLTQLINSATNTSESLLKDKPVQIEKHVDTDLPAIRGDRQRLLQILLNIISNACKFTRRGMITIEAHQQSDEVIITVKDTGLGIAPEDKALVFESFKQTQSGLRQGGGTGLGMPIAKSLTEAHGGRLWFESELDNGTTFYVALPIKSTLLVPTLT
jgi:signal transduction histidine kinase